MKLLVTPYINPDLDGTACAFAYAEFLSKSGKDAVAGIAGELHREAEYVMNRFNIPDMVNAISIVKEVDVIIIVDASNIRSMSQWIDPLKVVEIIDHRQIHEAHEFPNAKIQIELVGSAATLITEKFFENKMEISQESVVLLYSAIVSNTINFRAKVTTDRDKKMAEWLLTKVTLPQNYIHDMFFDKSQLKKTLRDTILEDLAPFNFKNFHLGIAQLEIVDASKFIRENLDEITNILKVVKKEKAFDFVFLTCIDLEKAFNEFVVIDEETKRILEEALDMKIEIGATRREGILMRKEIVPLVMGVEI